jgi:ferredoxin-NADP reductase
MMTLANKGWQLAKVKAIKRETNDVKSFMLELEDGGFSFVAGQHIDVRLTAPDGYQAQRAYSIASAPERTSCFYITVELLEDGEVSPYFHYVLQPDDQIEIRGPVGGPFSWRAKQNTRLLLVAGGSGVVPLMSMLKHRVASGCAESVPAVLLYSSRTEHHIIYRGELSDMEVADDKLAVLHTLTRHQPPGWTGRRRRVDVDLMRDAMVTLENLDPNTDGDIRCYICGPSDFVENSAQFAVELGIAPENVRTERFGPTGS